MAVHKYTRTGRWVAQHYDAKTGKRAQVGTFDTRREAVAALDAYRRDLEVAAGASPLTVAQLRDRWLDTPDWRESTRMHNEERTRSLAAEYGDLEVQKFGIGLARKWAEAHPSSVPAASALFGYGLRQVDDEDRPVVMFNPFTRLQTKRKRYRRDLPDEWLTATDVDRIESVARGMFAGYGSDAAAIWRFAAETGIRPGELFVLEEADLNVAAGELTVRRAASSKTNTIGPPKNGEARVIVLSARAAAAAASARRWVSGRNPVIVNPRTGLDEPWSTRGTARLFNGSRGQQLWVGSWGHYWRQVRAAAGRPGMDFYEARHYCATRLIEAGLSYDDVATQLGHADAQLIATTYGHPSKRLARERVRAALDGNHGTEAA